MFLYCPECRRKSPDFTEDKKLSCPACGFEFYHNTAAAVGILVKKENSYIILRRGREPGKGMLDLPGGFVDPGESAQESCHREIREELGVEIKNLQFQDSKANIYPYKSVTYHTCDLFFTAECSDEKFIRQEDEVEEILLLNKEEIDIDQFAFDSVRSFMKDILEKNSHPRG